MTEDQREDLLAHRKIDSIYKGAYGKFNEVSTVTVAEAGYLTKYQILSMISQYEAKRENVVELKRSPLDSFKGIVASFMVSSVQGRGGAFTSYSSMRG